MGTNQWGVSATNGVSSTKYETKAHQDTPYLCRVTYLNEFDNNGAPLMTLGRLRLDQDYLQYGELYLRVDCGGLILTAYVPECFYYTSGEPINPQCVADGEWYDWGWIGNHTINWDDYKVEFLTLDQEHETVQSEWSSWSACTNTCGHGTKTRTKEDGTFETIDCLGSCPGDHETLCKPYYNRGYQLNDGANPFTAVWPTRLRAGINIECDSENGFLMTDAASGDQIHMGHQGDTCVLSCENSLHKLTFTSDTSTNQNAGTIAPEFDKGLTCEENQSNSNKYITRGKRFGNYINNNPDTARCVPQFCYFPSNWDDQPMKPKYSHFDCSEGSQQLDNGDWLVPLDGFCTHRCNGGFRSESSLARVTCTNPIPLDQIDTPEYTAMIAGGLSYFTGTSTISMGFTGPLIDAFFDNAAGDNSGFSASKCYKIQDGHESCGGPPDLIGDETADAVEWLCDDGYESGSTCNKKCVSYYSYQSSNEPKTFSECSCKGTCKWKWNTTECKASLCPVPEWYWKDIKTCRLNGELLDYDAHVITGFPEGTICEDECELGYGLTYKGFDNTECRCDQGNSGNSCLFTQKKLSYCVPAVCTADLSTLVWAFSDGFPDILYDPAGDFGEDDTITPSSSHWDQLDCPEDAIWSGTGNPLLDGKVKFGATCHLRCIDGWNLVRSDNALDGIRCTNTFDLGYEWDVLWYTWSKYGECYHYDDAMYGCDEFPICVPDGWEYGSN